MPNKAPAFQFYPGDWTRDLEAHPLEIEGAWIRICCKLWWSETRGTLTLSIDQWSRILREKNKKTLQIFSYLHDQRIGEISMENDQISVTSRRMVKDETDRKNNNIRQKRFRDVTPDVTPMSRENNGDVTPYVTAMSQRSSSLQSSSTNLDKSKLARPKAALLSPSASCTEYQKPRGWSALTQEQSRKAEAICGELILAGWKAKPTPYAFVTKCLKLKYQPEAIISALKNIQTYKPENQWAYGMRIANAESQNLHEAEHMAEHEALKQESVVAGIAGVKRLEDA